MTSEELADILGTSTRTVFRELEGADMILSRYDCTLEKKMGKGYRLIGNVEEIAQKLQEQAERGYDDIYYTREYRRKYLTADGLKNGEFQKLGYYAHRFQVSEATVSNDINGIERWFTERGLTITKESGRAAKVKGDEKRFRDAMIEFFGDIVSDSDKNGGRKNRYKFDLNMISPEIDKQIATGFLNSDIVETVINILTGQLRLSENLAESSYFDMILCITVTIERIYSGHNIVLDEYILQNMKKDAAYKIISNLAESIEKEFDVLLSESEIGYIFMRLKSSRLQYSSEKRKEHGKSVLSGEYDPVMLAEDMVKIFSIVSGIDLTEDKTLGEGLLAHIIPSINRVCYGVKIQNPLLDEIRKQYAKTFKFCEDCCNIISTKYNFVFNEDEIGFLAFHFQAALERCRAVIGKKTVVNIGCVCPSGIGLSGLLAARIDNVFPNYVKVYTMSVEQAEDNTLSGIDILVSTIELTEKKIPVILVNPLLMERDIKKLETMLDDVRKKKIEQINLNRKRRKNPARDILEDIKIITLGSNQSKAELIEKLLEIKGIYPEEAKILKEAVLSREKLGRVVIQEKGFVMFHCAVEIETRPVVIFFRLDRTAGCSEELKEYQAGVLMIVQKNRNKEERETMAAIASGFIYEPQIIDAICENDVYRVTDIIRKLLQL